MKKILIIDYEKEFVNKLNKKLQELNFHVTITSNISHAQELIEEETFDLIISEIFGEDLQVLDFVVKRYNHSNFIIITNQNNDEIEVKALQLGILDYIKKNRSFEIIIKRILNLVKNPKSNNISKVLKFNGGKITLNLENRTIDRDGEIITLTKLEFELIVFFIKNEGIILSREEIIKKVWKEAESDIDLRVVDTLVKNIRKKISPENIKAMRGLGYKWIK